MTDSIHQGISVAASPDRILNVLTAGSGFSAATGGAPAAINPAEGEPLSCFGGMILGRITEVVPGRRLGQVWRVKNREPGVYSTARLELRPRSHGTVIVFEHTAFPASGREDLAAGWHANHMGAAEEVPQVARGS